MSGRPVVFLNPRTCGIYKNGAPRFKRDPGTGRRTDEIDNELIGAVEAYRAGANSAGQSRVALSEIFGRRVLVPTYYDARYNERIKSLLERLAVEPVTLGELLDSATLSVRGGHGSPGNDQRTGHVPYVKVSDIRGLRINVNPTNLVTEQVAKRFWRSDSSGLKPWDLMTPNRASSNIGEFAILLPGEEQIVVTKEVFVFRVMNSAVWDPFYLLWSLSLRAVREQWRRVALMQTNREDCGNRHREIVLPRPPTREWAQQKSAMFRRYFKTISEAKQQFIDSVTSDRVEYIASVASLAPSAEADHDASAEVERDEAT